MDASGDGVGDLRGIIEKLDYLNDGTPSSLGIDAIWLSPIFPSPMFDFGYDVSDYTAIDPTFGSMADFDELLREAHKRDIKIILDFVPNHTSHLHPWFIESKKSKTSQKRDWYIWRQPKCAGRHIHKKRPPFYCRPNNWQSVFGGSAWEWDEGTGEFYYHHFLKEQPDVNWRNPDLRKAMYDQMRFWLDKGVDGFRLDVINHIFKDDRLRNNPYRIGRRPYDMQRHLYDLDRPEAIEVVKEMRALVDEYGKKTGRERMLVGEVYIDDPRRAAPYYGGGTDGLNLAFFFKFSFMPFCARSFMNAVRLWEGILPKGAWPTYFLSNHDQPRHIGRYKAKNNEETTARAKVAATMLLTLRGTPFIYYGEEIGMKNLHIKRKDLKDPVGIRYWPIPVGRDMARTPMQWSDSESAGFTSSGATWLPLHPNFKTTNVQKEAEDQNSLLNFYRSLVWKRKVSRALKKGSIEIIPGTPRTIFAYIRKFQDESCLIVLNFENRKHPFPDVLSEKLFSKKLPYKILFSTHHPPRIAADLNAGFINPYEATIFRQEK